MELLIVSKSLSPKLFSNQNKMSAQSINKTLLRLIFEEPLEGSVVLDVGCGTGALSFEVAKSAKKVIGIDISEKAIEKARMREKSNISFLVMDAENMNFLKLGEIDMVVSHLCMSDKIIENSYRILPWNGAFVFACFHSQHLIEGGRRSRFSYTDDEMEAILSRIGYSVEYLEVETIKQGFSNFDEATSILGAKTVRRWRRDGRLESFSTYVENGGRHLSKSILIGKARKKVAKDK
jgi:ubiquinone/menaquinone biosynthesis C-methylase UbiE